MVSEIKPQITKTRAKQNKKTSFKTKHKNQFTAPKGYTKKLIKKISEIKKEPKWMLDIRLKGFEEFVKKPLPSWGPDLSKIDFSELSYFIKPNTPKKNKWNQMPKEIKQTFTRLGIPKAEKKHLAGNTAQFESDTVYSNIKKEWETQGVIYTSMDEAVQKHPKIVKEHFMKLSPINDNKFTALHASVWSGGSFLYVPENIKIELPFQSYFRMNQQKQGQFEHTLIIAEKNTNVSFIEGCTSTTYTENSLHSAAVEIYVKDNAQTKYTTIQNWSKNTYNLNTKRAIVGKNAHMEWIGGSIGSKTTMLYPCTILNGKNSTANHLNITIGSDGTWKDGGAKIIHNAPNTKSRVIAKSISYNKGKSVYRGLIQINKGATNAKSHVTCDALILDNKSNSSTYPTNRVHEPTATLTHEATVNKLSKEKIFYLMNRGLTEQQAASMMVLGFIENVTKKIPIEYAIEFTQLIENEIKKIPNIG
jgi:Fe-S cluster assembly protein SufB